MCGEGRAPAHAPSYCQAAPHTGRASKRVSEIVGARRASKRVRGGNDSARKTAQRQAARGVATPQVSQLVASDHTKAWLRAKTQLVYNRTGTRIPKR